MTVDPATDAMIRLALSHQGAGRLSAAEPLYRQVLARYPDHADVLHFLAALAGTAGRPDVAVGLLRRAVAVDPDQPDYHANLAAQFRTLNRPADAAAAAGRAAALRPDDADHQRNLGLALEAAGRPAAAAAAYARAVDLGSAGVAPLTRLGSAHLSAGDADAAEVAFARAVALAPASDPASATAHLGLALVHHRRGDLPLAVAEYRTSLDLDPGRADAWTGLCVALLSGGDVDGAVAAGRRAVSVAPADAEAQWRYGAALDRAGELPAAIAAFDRSVAARPDYAEPRFDRATALLLAGDFARGWAEYEWRWRSVRFPKWTFPPTRWDGRPAPGQTVLVVGEQGFGDMVQFARYLPAVAARCGRVVFVASPPVVPALVGLPGTDVVPDTAPVPAHDRFVTLLSLPLIFGTRLDTIPAATPYLSVDPARARGWRPRLGADGPLRVGLAWAGRPAHFNDRNRSASLAALAPLAAVPGVRFFALQVGPAAAQTAAPPAGMDLVDLGPDLRDFADTAAVLSHLDLLISVDTAPVHLAGALGRPTWVLLPTVPDWRWLLGRDDSPWYPSVRLFRQTVRGDWTGPVAAVADALRTVRSSRPRPGSTA